MHIRRRPAAARRILLALLVFTASLAATTAPTHDGAPPPPSTIGTLAQYWSGEAAWTYVRKVTSSQLGDGDLFWAASHIEVAGDTWYLFGRKTFPAAEPGCNEGRGISYGLTARASADKGATWSAPVDILTPTAGTPWACGVTDGDAYFSSGTWRYLAECWNNTNPVVHGACYFERHDPSPMGAFGVPPGYVEPVITAPELWSPICDADPADDCVRMSGVPNRLTNAGTFKIVDRDDTHFWVSMYGVDSNDPFTWYQGIVKTTDFRQGSWAAGGAGGTPVDATLDPDDARGWRESWWDGTSRGTGAADIAKEGDQYYYLAQFIDLPPGRQRSGCQEGDHWNWGMFRSSSLSATRWEQFPGGNPVFYSSRERETGTTNSLGCNREYAALFQDADGAWYMTMGLTTYNRDFAGVWLYRLEATQNLLRNGDFWTAGAEPWQAHAASLVASRALLQAPDATPYGILACTGPCGPHAVVWQEVETGALPAGATVHLGGKMATRGGGRARVRVALWQYEPATGWRTSGDGAHLEYTAGTNWESFHHADTLLPGATRLRYAIHALDSNPNGWCVDGLYLSAQARTPVATPWPCGFANTERNVLRNGDLGLTPGSTAEWYVSGATPGTFTAAMSQSHDGTPYGVFQCNGPCQDDAGIYQELATSPWTPAGATVGFGAKLATRGGGESAVALVLWQYNPTTNVWTPTSDTNLTRTVTGGWQHYGATATVLAGTTALRLSISAKSPNPYGWCIDDLYLTTGMVNPLASGSPCGIEP